jgi:hypothetical protein
MKGTNEETDMNSCQVQNWHYTEFTEKNCQQTNNAKGTEQIIKLLVIECSLLLTCLLPDTLLDIM